MPKGNPYGYFDNDQPDMDGMPGKKDAEYLPGRDRSAYGQKAEKATDRGASPMSTSPQSTHPLDPSQFETLAGCEADEEAEASVRRRKGFFPVKG